MMERKNILERARWSATAYRNENKALKFERSKLAEDKEALTGRVAELERVIPNISLEIHAYAYVFKILVAQGLLEHELMAAEEIQAEKKVEAKEEAEAPPSSPVAEGMISLCCDIEDHHTNITHRGATSR
jgi:hypothetical protein